MIKNTLIKSKADYRAESEQAMKEFLAKGGVIEVGKLRKNPKVKMASKSSKGFVTGTSGFANGYPRRTLGGI